MAGHHIWGRLMGALQERMQHLDCTVDVRGLRSRLAQAHALPVVRADAREVSDGLEHVVPCLDRSAQARLENDQWCPGSSLSTAANVQLYAVRVHETIAGDKSEQCERHQRHD